MLAVGKGGYVFLNNLGAQITSLQVIQVTGVHVLSISTSYNNWDAHYHIVYQYPNQVSHNTSYLYGQVTQRYILLPLNNDSLILTNSPNLIPLAKDTTKADNYFLSIYNNYSGNPYLVHWALNNITTINKDPSGNSCLQTLTNTLYWLKDKPPYSVQIRPDYYGYNASEVANISIAARSNLNLTFYGGINLNVEILDQNQSIVHTDQLVTSSSGPVYTSFQIPAIPSPSYTINATDGTLFFLESFTVQPTDYRVTEFNATPSTIYLGGVVLLNACVTVNGSSASEAVVYWSAIDRITYPNATFSGNLSLYIVLGSGVTNSSGYAAYNWVPSGMGIYEIVAWIRNYDGQPKNWTTAQVTVRGKPDLSVNLTSPNPGVIYVGDALHVDGSLILNSQALGGISVNVTIYDSNNHTVNYTMYTNSSGQFSLDWTPNAEGSYTIFCTSAGNSTLDSATQSLGFSAYRLILDLETNATLGTVYLGGGVVLLNACVTVNGGPVSGAIVYWSMINRINYPNATFANNFSLYTVLGSGVTNSSGYATYNWVPQEMGIYEIVAWIKNYDGQPKNWTTAQVTVRGKPELTVNLTGTNPEINYVGNTLRIEGNLTLNSQPLESGTSINVTIQDPNGHILNYVLYTNSSGCFSLDWTPTTEGIYTISCTFAGNSTLDTVNKSLEFSAYQMITGLETNAENGQIILGESLQIKANFSSLGFTPQLNDPVTLLVKDHNDNVVFSNEYTVDNLDCFQARWTPGYTGDYKVVLCFNQSYTVVSTSNTINVVYLNSNDPRILFITEGSNNYFIDWNNTLQGYDFNIIQVDLETFVSSPSIASGFDVLILDASCEGLNQTESQIIAGTGKPVLAVGKGGYEFLNNLGAQITPKIIQYTGVHVLSISTSYDNWDAHYHIVYQYPNRVSYNTSYLYGQVTQRYFLLPLNNDSLTLTNSPNLIPLAKDITNDNNYFLSIYNNYSDNPYLVHWALSNITTISQDPNGDSILQTLINTLFWLKDKNPYSVRVTPDSYEHHPLEVVNFSITAVDNLYQTLLGGITLNVEILDQNQSIVHTDQVITSSSGPVYTSFQIPPTQSTSYTINVTDGSLFFLESFTVQPTDYRVTEFNATPSTVYLGGGAVLLNACVTVEGNPAPEAVVYWSTINRITYPNATFADNSSLYTILGSGVTNSSGYAAYNWVPEGIGIYEIVAWIRNYDGQPKNWTTAQVTVRGEPELTVNLTGTNPDINYVGNTLRIEGNLTLNSQPLESGTSINVTIDNPSGQVANYVLYTNSSGCFSLDWTPNTEGIYTISCTFAGNSTLDSVTKSLEFSAYQLITGLETNAENGQITLGENLQITANFSSLGFTPQLNDPVTLLVKDINDNTVFSEEQTVTNLEYFQTQWTPQNLGQYKIFLYFNQSYTILSTNSTIRVVYLNSDQPSILFITKGSNNYFIDWNNTLQAQGFTVTQVDLETLVGDPSIASAFDVLILDTSCEGLTPIEAGTIAGTGKPVLAVGKGGYAFLNNLGAQITPLSVIQETGVHVLSISTSYNNWDIHYHIVYQYPNKVSYNTSYLYGQVTQRYFLLQLNNADLTLTNSPNLIPLAKDSTKDNNYFLSIYNNYSLNPYLVHWALNNITTISLDPNGNSILQTLTNTLYWLKDKTPYSVQVTPDSYEHHPLEVVNFSITAVDNLYQTLQGGIILNVKILDDNQSTVYTDQVTTSSSGPVYTSFQIPAIPSPSYTINVTDGSLFFLESFTVQATDYRVTEFNATPSTIYLGGGAVLLNACVTVEGNPAPEAIVYWSTINRITYPGATFADNPNLYTVLGSGVTNSSGYASYQWVPEKTGIYEIVAWIRNYDGQPENWTTAQVTVRGEPELTVNLIGTNSGITVGDTLNFEGNLTLCSQPLRDSVSINVAICCPDGRVVNYTIYTGSAGRFSLGWTPSTRGIHSVFFTFQGNLTIDSVTQGLEFAASQIVAGLETNAKNGQITLGESLQIKANFSSLGFTPHLNDVVTLRVTDLDDNIVFLMDYTIDNLDYFQTQWTPQYVGDYNIMLQFNQSYTIATPSSTIKVTSPGSGPASLSVLAGLSLGDSNNSGFTLPGALAVTSVGLLGSVVLFTRLRKNRNEFLNNWLRGGADTGGTAGGLGDEED